MSKWKCEKCGAEGWAIYLYEQGSGHYPRAAEDVAVSVLCEGCKNEGYEVDIDLIQSSGDAWSWMHHLLGKNWFGRRAVRRFVEIMAERFEIKLHPTSRGEARAS